MESEIKHKIIFQILKLLVDKKEIGPKLLIYYEKTNILMYVKMYLFDIDMFLIHVNHLTIIKLIALFLILI